jgi:preprotein translocase subunit SecG
MQTYLNIAQIILSSAVIVAVLFQVKGGGLGGIFGQADTVYRTKRGAEKTLFQLTIVLVALFIIVSIVALRVGQ